MSFKGMIYYCNGQSFHFHLLKLPLVCSYEDPKLAIYIPSFGGDGTMVGGVFTEMPSAVYYPLSNQSSGFQVVSSILGAFLDGAGRLHDNVNVTLRMDEAVEYQ